MILENINAHKGAAHSKDLLIFLNGMSYYVAIKCLFAIRLFHPSRATEYFLTALVILV